MLRAQRVRLFSLQACRMNPQAMQGWCGDTMTCHIVSGPKGIMLLVAWLQRHVILVQVTLQLF